METDDYIDELFDRYDPDELVSLAFDTGHLTIPEFRDIMRDVLRRVHEDEDSGR